MKHNKKGRHSQFSFRISDQLGQALILVMAIVLIASVIVFLVFNSGRAVNEKINLVNAADAAAYSGAQIAARQLNFMAYTNRAMIANELAIGHVLSFQMEVDVTTQSLSMIADFLSALLGWIPWIGPLISDALQYLFVDAVGAITEGAALFTGAYASLVDANTAVYSSLQYEAYKDLVYPVEGRTLIEAAMGSVLREYQLRSTAPISLNHQSVLEQFEDSDNDYVSAAARDARDMGAGFCQMVLFVTPSNDVGGDLESNNDTADFCSELAESGVEGNQSGSPGNPMADDGGMLEMLRTMVSEFGNAEWIRDRNSNYRILGFNITRRGSTTVEVGGANDSLNWRAGADSLRVGDPLLNIGLGTFRADGDISTLSSEAVDRINESLGMLVDRFSELGLCKREGENDANEPSCEDALMNRYEGVRRYAHLNPSIISPVITAFLSQTSCGDSIGVDAEGNRYENWHDGPRFLDESRPFCNSADHPTVYAVSQASVFFERPPCDDDECAFGFRDLRGADGSSMAEVPNLFNPFWQARLAP